MLPRNILVLCLLFFPAISALAEQDDKLRLQLKWTHQFQFAGYYAAIEQGYYAEQGLAVDLIPATPGIDPVANVLAGGAEYGVGTSDLLMLHHQGEPIVVLAVIFQHSPLVLLSNRQSKLDSIHDLKGRRVAIEPGSAELFAYLKREGLTADNFELVSHQMQLTPLLRGDIRAQSAYVTTEPFELDEYGIAYQIYSPRSAGIDFYGDNLFTSQKELETHPERAAAFRRASLRGWYYAMNNIEETIDLILDNYPTSRSREALQFEAEHMQRLMRTDLIEPGHMIPGRWRHMVEIYAEMDMLPADMSLDGFLYKEGDYSIYLGYFYSGIFLLVILVVIFAAISYYKGVLNRRLRRSEERFRTIFDHAPLAFIVSDSKGRISSWNAEATRIFGWHPEEVLGKSLVELLVAPDVHSTVESVLKATVEGDEQTKFVNENITRDGKVIVCEWANAPYYIDGAGQHDISTVSIGVDITERLAMENSLRAAKNEAQDALEDSRHLLSVLSHELRSPMSAIGYSTEVIDNALSESRISLIPEMTQRIRNSLSRLRNFVNGLTVEDRLLELGMGQATTVNMYEFLSTVVATLQNTYPQRKVDMQVRGSHTVMLLDAVMLDILITNLLDNAIKYSPTDSLVELSVDTMESGWIYLQVADRGPGIEHALREKLFRKYVRGKQVGMAGGVGLGLFLVKRIVEKFQGEIVLEERKGGGSTFRVSLPPAPSE